MTGGLRRHFWRFIPTIILIFIESLKVGSLRCCFYTCTRLSSYMPFLPKCSRSLLNLSVFCPLEYVLLELTTAARIFWKPFLLQSVQEVTTAANLRSLQSAFYHLRWRIKFNTHDVTGVGFAFIIILFLIRHCIFLIMILSLMVFRSIMDLPIYLHLLVRFLC